MNMLALVLCQVVDLNEIWRAVWKYSRPPHVFTSWIYLIVDLQVCFAELAVLLNKLLAFALEEPETKAIT